MSDSQERIDEKDLTPDEEDNVTWPLWYRRLFLFEILNFLLIPWLLPESVKQYIREWLDCYLLVRDRPDPALAHQAFHDFVVYLALSQSAVLLLTILSGLAGFVMLCLLASGFRYFLRKGKQEIREGGPHNKECKKSPGYK